MAVCLGVSEPPSRQSHTKRVTADAKRHTATVKLSDNKVALVHGKVVTANALPHHCDNAGQQHNSTATQSRTHAV